jgi:hypothetical protein
MTRGDWQFLASAILALALGIPAIKTFASGDASLIALTILVTATSCFTGWYLWYRLHLPSFTVQDYTWLISVKDSKGDNVVVRKSLVLSANHPGVDTFAHRGNASDGAITGFRVDPGVSDFQQYPTPGGITVRVRFPNALPVGVRTTTWLEADHDKAFTKPTEYFIADVDMPMKHVRIEVAFPNSRLPTKMTVVRKYAANDYQLEDRATNENPLVWDLRTKWSKVPLGEYHLRWWW